MKKIAFYFFGAVRREIIHHPKITQIFIRVFIIFKNRNV